MKSAMQLMVFVILAFLIADPARAQSAEDFHPFLTDKFNIGIGFYRPDRNLTLRVDGTEPEEEIDFDESFNLDEKETTGQLNFRWRFGEKWSFWGQYWNVDSSGGAVLEEDLEWEDVIFKEGTFANAGFDVSIARLFFGRTFHTGPQHEFGLGGGFHWLEIGAFVEGQILTNFAETEFARESVSADFPLPNIGGWYMYSWSPKWLVQARVDWLSATVGDYSGGLWNVQAGINWQPTRHFGIGLQYQVFDLNVDVDSEDWNGKAQAKQHGPLLTLNATW